VAQALVAETAIFLNALTSLKQCASPKSATLMMAVTEATGRRRRVCFVTIGATANFDSLIKAVLSPSFLQALQVTAYTNLVIQHGTEGAKIYKDFVDANPTGSEDRFGLEIRGFDFNKQGLGMEMRATKGDAVRSTGVVFSHAGAH
jgi:beta-1,4-N-acetylglucosaminyltransferase